VKINGLTTVFASPEGVKMHPKEDEKITEKRVDNRPERKGKR
jgi:hypothetical protein